MMPWTNKQDALGLGHAVADLGCVADGRDGPVGCHVGSAEDRVGELQPDLLADHLLEENADRASETTRLPSAGGREAVEDDLGTPSAAHYRTAERQEELAVEPDRQDVLALFQGRGRLQTQGIIRRDDRVVRDVSQIQDAESGGCRRALGRAKKVR